MKSFLSALIFSFGSLVILSPCFAASPLFNDYAKAREEARKTRSLLMVACGVICDLPAADGVVRCVCPVEWRKLAAHKSLAHMKGRGVFIADFDTDGRVPIVSILPREHCTPSKLRTLVNLPRGTLTQRTLIWAVRVHPEHPRSTEGTAKQVLLAHAATNNRRQVGRQQQGHHTPIGYLGNASEVAAESWPWNKNIVDGALDCVDSWRHSPGHWRGVSSPNRGFGYDMQTGPSKWFGGQYVWYGTGVFLDN